MERATVLNKILQYFIEGCQQRKLELDKDFAQHYVHMLSRDARDGLDTHKISSCKVQRFLSNLFEKYENPLDATMCSLKFCYYYKNSNALNLEAVKQQYEQSFKQQLRKLIDDILQYPETSNKEQIENMFVKMQVFIIACYNIGCPKNHVLIKQTRQSLNSVLGRGDLQNYVLKKKHHRLEYLQRLSATVCGILIYNNMRPHGEKENMRDIRKDLEMAQRNTIRTLETLLKRVSDNKCSGTNAIEHIIQLDVKEQKVLYYWPIEKVRDINKYVILYCIYERALKEIYAVVDKTEYLISVGLDKLKCVIEKINDVLKYRTAVDSEAIFPHFVYLSEVWQSLVMYLNHLAEINKVCDTLESLVTEEIENRYFQYIDEGVLQCQKHKAPYSHTFEERIKYTNKKQEKNNLPKIRDFSTNYCSLTLALTNGILVPSNLQKKLCTNLDMRFGFLNIELAKYAERNFEEYLKTFNNAVFTSIDLILLFDLESEILNNAHAELYGDGAGKTLSKNGDCDTQTEMVIVGDLSVPNQINVTWNKWDFHRETIRLANIRKRQTHSTQTVVTYGRRNAQNQAYYTRHHKTNDFYSSK